MVDRISNVDVLKSFSPVYFEVLKHSDLTIAERVARWKRLEDKALLLADNKVSRRLYQLAYIANAQLWTLFGQNIDLNAATEIYERAKKY